MKCWQVDPFLLTVDEKKLDFSPSCQTHKIPISWHKTSKTQHFMNYWCFWSWKPVFLHFITQSYFKQIQKKSGSILGKILSVGMWELKSSKISKFLKFRILRKMFSQKIQGCSLIFLDLIQVILFNKMKKYGLPEPKTSIIHEMLSFRPLMPWNRDFISLPWRRKIQLRH